MESLVKQRRVRFSGPELEESSVTRERIVHQRHTEGSKLQNWFQMQFPRQMSQDYDSQYSEFAIAVAAAAFSIHSLEEAEAQRRMRTRDDLEQSSIRITSEKEGIRPSSSRTTRRLSIKEDETSGRKSNEQDRLARQPSRQPSARRMTLAAEDQKQRGNSSRHNGVRTRADTWEKAQLEKINKRYQKLKSSILAWENNKKMQAKLKMERRKGELEERKSLNQLHYQNKVARIDHIAEGARKQAEEKRRSEESEVRDKAKRIRSTGKEPVKCFCF